MLHRRDKIDEKSVFSDFSTKNRRFYRFFLLMIIFCKNLFYAGRKPIFGDISDEKSDFFCHCARGPMPLDLKICG